MTDVPAVDTLLDHICEGIVLIDDQHIIQQVNLPLKQLFGITDSSPALINANITTLIPDFHDININDYICYSSDDEKTTDSQPHSADHQCSRFDGSEFFARLVIKSITQNKQPWQLITVTDITTHKSRENLLTRFVNFDPLTGLPNRVLLFDRLQQSIKKAQRENQMIAVVYMDLNDFKIINDTLGHAAGDRLLKEVSSRVKSTLREQDTIARIGGDEFVIILEGIRNKENVKQIAKQLSEIIAKPYHIDGREVLSYASLGVSLFPAHGKAPDTLLKNADMAMYHAKKKVRSTIHFYTLSMTTKHKRRLSMASSLSHALKNNEFIIHYQPKINISTGHTYGCEALLRWNRPKVGLIPPNEFIPFLEENGQIIEVGQWVLEQACQQAVTWNKTRQSALEIAVNVSPIQVEDPGFFKMVKDTLDKTGLPAQLLELEVTESLFMNHQSAAAQNLFEIIKLGANISIDDFGTGYSSLSQLHVLPVTWLKIDRMFIKDIGLDGDNQDARHIVEVVIKLARLLGLKVIAEGVEDEASLHYLGALKCDAFQGFYNSVPLPADQFIAQLTH